MSLYNPVKSENVPICTNLFHSCSKVARMTPSNRSCETGSNGFWPGARLALCIAIRSEMDVVGLEFRQLMPQPVESSVSFKSIRIRAFELTDDEGKVLACKLAVDEDTRELGISL